MKHSRKIIKWLGLAVASPIALFLLLAIIVYLPPVQQWAVNKAAEKLGESLGAKVTVERVRLSFPLDLALDGTLATQDRDTLLDVRTLRLGVRLMPLFKGRADVDEFALYRARVNTKNLISDIGIKGRVGELTAASHGADWQKEHLRLDRVVLRNADLDIALSDTAAPDTSKSSAAWVIALDEARIHNARLRLSMPGDSMRIGLGLGDAKLTAGQFDLGRGTYAVKRLRLDKSAVTYDLPYVRPMAQGIDPSHIGLSNVTLDVENVFANNAADVKADIKHLSLMEKGGFELKQLVARVEMDTLHLRLTDGRIVTPTSRLTAEANIDFRSLGEHPQGSSSATLGATLSPADLRTLCAGYVDNDILKKLPQRPATLQATLTGNMQHTTLESVALDMPGIVRAKLSGHARNVVEAWRAGHVQADVTVLNAAPLLAFAPKSVAEMFDVPAGTRLTADVNFRGDFYQLRANAATAGGTLQARGNVNLAREQYDVTAQAHQLPLGRLLRGMDLQPFSGQLTAAGHGFDVLSARSALKLDADVARFAYAAYDLSGLTCHLTSSGGSVDGTFAANTPILQANGTIAAKLANDITAALRLDIPSVDLLALGFVKDTLQLGTTFALDATTNRAFTTYSAQGSFSRTHFTTTEKSIPMKDIDFDLAACPDTTTARVSAGDLNLRFGAKGSPERFMPGVERLMAEISRQWDAHAIDQPALRAALPVVDLFLDAGTDNPLYNIARYKGYTFSSAFVSLGADPREGLHGVARLGSFNTGSLQLDTVHCRLLQDTAGVRLLGEIKNYRKLNPNIFTATIDASVEHSGAGAAIKFFDKDGDEGVDLGLRADMVDNGLRLHLYPQHPVLAYRQFEVNKDNFIQINKDFRIDAAVDLIADDGTGVKIYSQPNDSTNDLTISLNRVNLSELSTVLPYLPTMSGMLSGDVHVTGGTPGHDLSAMASCQAHQFGYDGVSLGNVGLEAIYLPKRGGEHHASAFISVADEEVMALEGTYFDKDGGSFEGDADLHDFPLPMLNAFLTGTDVALRGKAAGKLNVSGTTDHPIVNGALDLDSAHVYSDVYGFDFRAEEREVSINAGKVVFDKYKLYSTGKEPLVVDGTLDMSNFSNIRMNFLMQAKNFELINTRRKAKSMVFGKVYANFLGQLSGNMNHLGIRGKLEVLDRTNMTYVLKDSPLAMDNRMADLVQFQSFEDSTAVAPEPVPQMAFDMVLGISVNDAARFHCDLSEDGQSYADLVGGGDLTFRYTESGEMRLTGRFTTSEGEMKYQLPVIPLKKFKLTQGCYVEFTGDPMNPTLAITAKERVKAVVTEADDRQRSVAFDVGVALTKPLNEMGLEFTIEAPEDLTVQNQLASMSKEQRGKAAVTMLATGMYMTDETMMSGSGFKATNALNAFLQNEIQNIAGSALKTIDINLGVESGTSASGTQTTDYSFQFAKRFWGDRISVIVGGKVSTGANATNTAESFINNVSIEYKLDRSASRYVRVFYDRETQDPFEGQLTRTGAGLVLRRKTDRLGELFIFKKKEE